MTHVTVEEIQAGIFQLTLQRPQSMNALSMALIGELLESLRQLAAERRCRVIILTGAGRAFCAGAELKDSSTAPGTAGMGMLGAVYKTQEYLAQLMLAVRESPKPVIAAINGPALGGGLALALASDLRLASSAATFGSVFIKMGLSSCDVGVSYLLPRIVGPARAAELMLTGRVFDAVEAQQLGLVLETVAPEALLERALALAGQIVQNNEYGVWMTKLGLAAGLDAPSLRHAMEMENRTQVLGYFTGNMEEAMQAFVERRAPSWKPL